MLELGEASETAIPTINTSSNTTAIEEKILYKIFFMNILLLML